MRIVFLGTGEIGLPSLDALLASPAHRVVAVVTQPDKPVGRSQALTPPQVKVRAQASGIPVLQPERLRRSVDMLAPYEADVFVVVAYGQILPKAVLDLPRLGCLNIHASLLPRHRGASPIQAAIREGDAESGVTIMWMDEGLDTGDILLQTVTPLGPEDTGGALHDRLALLAPHSLERALEMVEHGSAPRIPQEAAQVTHSGKLERADGRLEWSRSAVDLERLIRAYTPWPGTFTTLPGPAGGTALQLKVHRACPVESAHACPVGGTVLDADHRLIIACGQGVLELLEVQLEGRKRMGARDFLQGYAVEAGTVLK